MIDEIKEKMAELKRRKDDAQPKIDKLEEQRKNEVGAINKQFDKMVEDVTADVTALEEEVYNDLIKSFEKAVMSEFDAKRSTSAYSVTQDLKNYKEFIAEVDGYPEELKEKIDQVADEVITIEDVAYHVEELMAKYLK